MTKNAATDLRKPFAPLMRVIDGMRLKPQFDELIRLATATKDGDARAVTAEAEIESLRATIATQGKQLEQAVAAALSLMAVLTGDTATTSTALKGRSRKRVPHQEADKKAEQPATERPGSKTWGTFKGITAEQYDELTLNLHRSLPRGSDEYKDASRRMATRLDILKNENWQSVIDHIMSATSGKRFIGLATRIYLRTDSGFRESILIALANATTKSQHPWTASNLKAEIELRIQKEKQASKKPPPAVG